MPTTLSRYVVAVNKKHASERLDGKYLKLLIEIRFAAISPETTFDREEKHYIWFKPCALQAIPLSFRTLWVLSHAVRGGTSKRQSWWTVDWRDGRQSHQNTEKESEGIFSAGRRFVSVMLIDVAVSWILLILACKVNNNKEREQSWEIANW